MQNLSMEGFGVIDLRQIENLREAFGFLSQLSDFPDEELMSAEFLTDFQENFPEIDEKEVLLALVKRLQEQPLQELQADYSSIFELNKRLTLYLTYYRLGDSKEQGNVLSKLKMLYEMFGLHLEKAELTDYLPTMLEFLATADFSNETENRLNDLSLLFSILEDGTFELLNASKDLEGEPYITLLVLIRQILSTCVLDKGVTEQKGKLEND